MTDTVTIRRELLERCALLLTDSLYPPDGCSGFDDWTAQGNELAEELRAILAAPVQGDGLEVRAIEQHHRTDGRIEEHELCRLSDAQRAIAEVGELVEALRAADEYLSSNRFNEIGSGSILHRQMQDALAKLEGKA